MGSKADIPDVQPTAQWPLDGQWPCQHAPMPNPPPRLLGALYCLMRDHVSPGDLEQVMLNVEGQVPGTRFTNPHLEWYARALCTYLLHGECIPPTRLGHTGQPTGDNACDDDHCPVCGDGP